MQSENQNKRQGLSGGVTSGPPPKRGPNPQGLNVPLKQVKITNPENINGRYRQIVTKRKNIDRG